MARQPDRRDRRTPVGAVKKKTRKLTVEAKIRRALSAAGKPIKSTENPTKVVLCPIPSAPGAPGARYVCTVISPRFERMGPQRRQQHVWGYLELQLTKTELNRVKFVLVDTPQEYADLTA